MTFVPLPAVVGLPFLGELVALFSISVLIAYVCYRLHLVPIAGFLIAGAIVGPYALGVVDDVELVNQLAEIGVILLLFTIGVEFSFEELKEVGSFIFTGGGIQVGVTVLLTVGVVVSFGAGWELGIFTGFLVALSSTAVVLGLLSQRAETDTPFGRLSLGILIFQDLAIVAMVLVIPLLGGEATGVGGILTVLGKAVLLIFAILFLARRAVPWILEWIARTRRQELFLLTVVAICFGTAWVTSWAGVSLALGAFLAGLVVSESRFREHALSEILPLRTVFNAVFFVSIGMLFNVDVLLEHPIVVIAVAGGILMVKWIVTTGTILALGYPARIAIATGLIVAQIGEFSFVINTAGREVGLSPAGLGAVGEQAFIAIAVILMLVTPFSVQIAPKIGAALSGFVPSRTSEEAPSGHPTPEFEDHVVVVGYGPAGRRLVQVLRNTGLDYIVLELNPTSVTEARREGVNIVYGDAARLPMLQSAAIRKAKVLVVAINDRSATQRIVRIARYENPTLQIFARTRFLREVGRLTEVGADVVVPEEMETTVRLFTHVLNAYMVAPDEVARQVNLIRADDYSVIRGSIQEAHMMVLQGLDEEGLHTRAVAVREGAPVVGRSLAELELRNRYDLTVLAVRREGQTIGSPAGDFRVQAGDRLVLIGTADQFSQCADLFRSQNTQPDPEAAA